MLDDTFPKQTTKMMFQGPCEGKNGQMFVTHS